MFTQLINTPIFSLILNLFEELNVKYITVDILLNHLEQGTEFSHSTIIRRIATLSSWIKWIDDFNGFLIKKDDRIYFNQR